MRVGSQSQAYIVETISCSVRGISMETEEKQWLMIGADSNSSFCVLKAAIRGDFYMSSQKHFQVD